MSEIKLIDFGADWCGPCQMQDDIVDEVEQELDIEVERIDVDEHQDMANEYNVRGIPFLVLEVDGTVDASFQGLTQFENIEDAVKTIRNA